MKSRQSVSLPDGGSRFETWGRTRAVIALILLVGTIALGAAVTGSSAPAQGIKPQASLDWSNSDEGLYKAIIVKVRHGESYYDAAVGEQRARNYPVRPAITVREPGVTYLGAVLGGARHLYWVIAGIGFCMIVALMWRLESIAPGKNTWRVAVLLSGFFSTGVFKPEYAVDTEIWAGVFIMLALISRSLPTFWPSVVFGLLACLTRELAFPLLAVMAFFAWREGKRKEAAAWVGTAVVFLGVYAVHLANVASVTGPGDPKSQGWLEFGGLPFVVETIRHTSALIVAPAWVTAVVIPLAVFGWLSRRSSFADRVLALLASYFVVFMLIGRTQNSYWGTLYVSFMGAGLAFSVSGLLVLVRTIRSGGPSSVAAEGAG